MTELRYRVLNGFVVFYILKFVCFVVFHRDAADFLEEIANDL